MIRIACSLGTVLILCAVAWWLASGGESEAKPGRDEAKGRIRSVPVRTEKLRTEKDNGAGDATADEAQQRPDEVRVDASSSASTATNKVFTMSPEDAEAFERVKRDTSLRTMVEDRMALLATIKPGMPVPPMPPIPNLDEDFAKAETNVIRVTEGDTEKDLLRKLFVIALKERISEAKAQGKTASEALNEYVDAMRHAADFRQKALLTARQMERDGDAEGAKELVDAANAELADMGAELIDLHPPPKGKKGKTLK